MSTVNDDKLVQQLRRCLDQSIVGLDEDISARLDQMRRAALAAMDDVELNTQQSAAVRETLDQSLQLDAATATRLNQIRQRAMDRAEHRTWSLHGLLAPARQMLSWLDSRRLAVPASVFATACVIVTVVSLGYNSTSRPGGLAVDEDLLLVA
ncbi:MAG: hypothetical protein RL120_11685 [Gammaproteobacteria bacterium]